MLVALKTFLFIQWMYRIYERTWLSLCAVMSWLEKLKNPSNGVTSLVFSLCFTSTWKWWISVYFSNNSSFMTFAGIGCSKYLAAWTMVLGLDFGWLRRSVACAVSSSPSYTGVSSFHGDSLVYSGTRQSCPSRLWWRWWARSPALSHTGPFAMDADFKLDHLWISSKRLWLNFK